MLLATLLLIPVGFALLAAGLRGRRTDDHPLCRRCGYDLTGRPADAARCPECGADLSRRRAVRVGHRRRRTGWTVAGLVLIVVVQALAYPAARRILKTDPITLAPFWWLRHELNGQPAARSAAIAELTRRLAARQLSDGRVAAVADRALLAQVAFGDHPSEWWTSHPADLDASMALLKFAERANDLHKLDADRWEAYARQTFLPGIMARPIVRQGDPLPLDYTYSQRAWCASIFARFGLRDLRIDGLAVEPGQSTGDPGRFIEAVRVHLPDDMPPQQASIAEPLLDGLYVRGLSPGLHVVTGVVRVITYEGVDDTDVDALADAPPPPGARLLATTDVPVSATFQVCDVARVPPLTTVATSPDDFGLMETRLSVRPGERVGSLQVHYSGTLAVRAVHVFVRSADGSGPEVQVDKPGDERNWYLWLTSDSFYTQDFTVPLDRLGAVRRLDVILRPAPDLAILTTNMQAAWGNEAVIRNVPRVVEKP